MRASQQAPDALLLQLSRRRARAPAVLNFFDPPAQGIDGPQGPPLVCVLKYNPPTCASDEKGPMPGVDQTVELQEFCALGHSQVIMPTANSSASEEVVTAALLVIGGKILSGRAKYRGISVGGYRADRLAERLDSGRSAPLAGQPGSSPALRRERRIRCQAPRGDALVRCPAGIVPRLIA
jgi:hypothetical protein